MMQNKRVGSLKSHDCPFFAMRDGWGGEERKGMRNRDDKGNFWLIS